ncbi:tetratricopeptide repeat protein [bacterium]|nr:tetratricopeptide repeat protein [bacterium]
MRQKITSLLTERSVHHMFIFGLLMISLLPAVSSGAQDIGQLLRLGTEYETAGHWKQARQLYESMLLDNPDHPLIIDRLKSLYIRTFAFDDARNLLENEIRRNPGRVSLEVDLAHVIFLTGNEKDALDRWYTLLKRHEFDAGIYPLIADVMTDERLYDKAADVYLLARKNLRNNTLYAVNLAQLYAAQLNFRDASRELVLYLNRNRNQLHYVKSVYLRFPVSSRVLTQLEEPILDAVEKNPDALFLYQLLTAVYEHHGLYDKALKMILALEKRPAKENRGNALFSFAETVFTQGAVQEAKTAYLEILTSYPRFQHRNQVLIGLAKCYEAEENPEKAVSLYQQIADEYPDRGFSASALLRKGLIQRDALFDVRGAVQTFQYLIRQYQGSSEHGTAELELASCYLKLNQCDSASILLNKNVSDPVSRSSGHRMQSLFLLAQSQYFQGSFSNALTWLDSLSAGKWLSDSFQHPLVNDALRLRFFIKQHQERYPVQLQRISHADFLIFQRKFDQALVILDSLTAGKWTAPIQADASFRIGSTTLSMNRYTAALNHFQKIPDTFPHHYLADQAIERCGTIYEKMGQKKSAVNQYERLLTDYPHSLFADEARNRIRILEQDRS